MNDREPSDWQELTRLTGGAPFVVERVRLAGKDIAIEGAFQCMLQFADVGLKIVGLGDEYPANHGGQQHGNGESQGQMAPKSL